MLHFDVVSSKSSMRMNNILWQTAPLQMQYCDWAPYILKKYSNLDIKLLSFAMAKLCKSNQNQQTSHSNAVDPQCNTWTGLCAWIALCWVSNPIYWLLVAPFGFRCPLKAFLKSTMYLIKTSSFSSAYYWPNYIYFCIHVKGLHFRFLLPVWRLLRKSHKPYSSSNPSILHPKTEQQNLGLIRALTLVV